MKIIKGKLFYTLLLVCFLTKSFGQSAINDSAKFPHSYWGAVGLGNTTLGGFSGLAAINAEVADHFVVTASATAESSSIVFTKYNEYTTNAMAGWVFKQRHFLIDVSAGLGYVHLSTFDSGLFFSDLSTTPTYKNTIGLPILMQAYWVVLPAFAIGLGGYANLNSVKTTAGFTVSLAFGRMMTYKK